MKSKNRIQKAVSFTGIGLHTGKNVQLTIRSGEAGSGIKFVRTDLEPNVTIAADANLVTQTQRGTTLQIGEVKVSTVEHLLSAINSLQIEDALIEINGPEIPILDGSAIQFVHKLKESGLESYESEKEELIIEEPLYFEDETTGSQYTLMPSEKLQITSILHFGNDSLGEMSATLTDIDQFPNEFANCRTFVFLSEVEALFDQGLIKGGDIDNALIIIDRNISDEDAEQLQSKLGKAGIQIKGQKVISAKPMIAENEPARHKLLDLLGDLTLVGRDIRAKIIAVKPGHTSNVALAKKLKALFTEKKKNAGRPHYDPNSEPVMGLEEIKSYLPHRYPFLLIDKIIEISDKHIVGIKNVTSNEAFFQGHFPGNPIFPGVLQMEALAQTGGILALSTVEDKGNWDTYFLKMDRVKFKSKVQPGDTLILKMELMMPIRRGIVQMWATAYVGNKLISEGELTAQIIKRQYDK